MKTITIKLPEQEAKELDIFIKMETKLTKESLESINKSIREIKEGKTISLEEVRKKYGL